MKAICCFLKFWFLDLAGFFMHVGVSSAYVYLNHTYIYLHCLHLRKPEKGITFSFKLELQMVVSLYVGAGI